MDAAEFGGEAGGILVGEELGGVVVGFLLPAILLGPEVGGESGVAGRGAMDAIVHAHPDQWDRRDVG